MGEDTKYHLNQFINFRKNEIKKHELNYIFWESTLRCNLSCRHCGSDCFADNKTKDMPYHDFLHAIDQIKDYIIPNQTTIAIIGGESLLRKDLEIVGNELKIRGFPWGIVSNGYDLSKNRFLSLKEAGLKTISLSLDGLEWSHNWLRNNKNSFQNALQAISVVVENPDIAFDVITCVNNNNINELHEIKDLLIDLQVRNWRIISIFPRGRAKNDESLMLDKSSLLKVFNFIILTKRENRINLNYGCESYVGDYELKIRNYPFFCRAGINIASILADGSITGCISARASFIQGNIYKDNFKKCWIDKFKEYRNRDWTKNAECEECKDFIYCNGGSLHLRDAKNHQLFYCHNKVLNEI
jgi:radical SAM enzyme (rSAM/lipoprotein system)